MLFFLGRKLHLSHLHHCTPNPWCSTWLWTGTPFKLVKYFKISVLPSINKNSFFFTLHRLNKNIFTYSMVTAAKSLQSCPTLCNPTDSSPPGSPISGILQARTLEWVAMSFSDAWKWSRSVVSDSQRPHGLQPTRLLRPWDFPGKSIAVGCHCLLHILW